VYSKTVTVSDFRGIPISPVISKVFEHCMLERYGSLQVTISSVLKRNQSVHMQSIH